MSGMIRLRFSVALWAFCFWIIGNGSVAYAAKADVYEAVWQLEQTDPAPKIMPTSKFLDLGGSKDIYETRLIPDRLFVAANDAKSANGIALFERGTQLVEMEYPNLLVCSLVPGLIGTLSNTKRVCLLDEDGDGDFDSYFTRILGRDFFASDMLWFVMNAKIPAKRDKFDGSGFSINQIDNKLFQEPIKFTLSDASVSSSGDRLSMSVIIGNRTWLTYHCSLTEYTAESISEDGCSPPGFEIKYAFTSGDRKFVSVRKKEQITRIRFFVRFGMIAGKILEGAELY